MRRCFVQMDSGGENIVFPDAPRNKVIGPLEVLALFCRRQAADKTVGTSDERIHKFNAVAAHTALRGFYTALYFVIIALCRLLDMIIHFCFIPVNILIAVIAIFFSFVMFFQRRSGTAPALFKTQDSEWNNIRPPLWAFAIF